MKRLFINSLVVLFLASAASNCLAYPIQSFDGDLDKLLTNAKDVVVAKCVAKPDGFPDGFIDLEQCTVDVLMVLKGDRKLGPLKIAVGMTASGRFIKKDTIYLLINTGGTVGEIDFVAAAELSVVEVPNDFSLDGLKEKNLREAVEMLLSRQLHNVEQEMAPLQHEQGLLGKALQNRITGTFDSHGDVSIDTIQKTSTDAPDALSRYLNLGGAKLAWSIQSEGNQTGYVYYQGAPPEHETWEFASSDSTNIDDFDGKPLKAKFLTWDSPGVSGQSITVKSGQILLARTQSKPNTVYIIKFGVVKQEGESVVVRYAVVNQIPAR